MDKNSNLYTMLFAVAVCVVLAVVLASTYNALKASISENKLFDKKRNILIAVGLYDPRRGEESRRELERLFADHMRAKVLEIIRDEVPVEVMEAGERKTVMENEVVDVVETGYGIAELDDLRREEEKKPASERREFAAFYTRVDEDGEPVAYCVPISGYGLWSTLYGYLALKSDLDRVQGITFYEHAETPGLGGEVDNPAWQDQWRDKRIFAENGELTGVTVKKGKVDPSIPEERLHEVDGLSGATITSNGVTRFVREDLQTYLPYFRKLRQSR